MKVIFKKNILLICVLEQLKPQMSKKSYSQLPQEIISRIDDILTLLYVNQRGSFPKFVSIDAPSSEFRNPATFRIVPNANSLRILCADPLFQFPEDLTVDPVQLATITAERKRVDSFRRKDDEMKLTILSLINLIDPSITKFDQAFAMLRMKNTTLAADPSNSQYLTNT